MDLRELTDYLDAYLRISEVPDSSRALNGLQVENAGAVTRLAVAVDASEASVRAAADEGCDLLLVHHGLFWGGNQPVTGRRYRRLKPLFDNGIAVYSAHLPLDLHPEVGNNAVLARELGVDVEGGFGVYEGVEIGVHGALATKRDALSERLRELLGGGVKVVPGGDEEIETVAIVSGGGGKFVTDAAEAGIDVLITGEGAHHNYFDAVEGGLTVYFGGHYATETWGVRALAEHIEARYGLEWTFLDQPTGL